MADLKISFTGEQVDVVKSIDLILKKLTGLEKKLDGVEKEAKDTSKKMTKSFAEMSRKTVKSAPLLGGIRFVRFQAAFVEAQPRVGHDQSAIKLQAHAQSGAVGARSVRVVETEQPRFQFGEADLAVGIKVILTERPGPLLLPIMVGDSHEPAR